MLPVLQVGPLALQVPGLVILVGAWLGLSLAERNAWRYSIKAADLYNLVFIALVSGVIGARLTVVITHPAAFRAAPWNVFSLNPGLLDATGGLFFVLLAGLIYGQRKKLPLWSTLDALTPALAVLQVAIGFSHLASGTAFGMPSGVPWAIGLWGELRHPTQVYEILAAGLILALLWPGRGPIRPSAAGLYFLSFVGLSAGARLFLEAFRGDSSLVFGGYRSAQLGAWLVLAASLVGAAWLKRLAVGETQSTN